ncbi:MAG: membrane protein YczE [Gaiellaceae bacterium]
MWIPRPRARRLGQLYAGLVLYGVSDGMLLAAGLGVDPWDVFQQGLSRRLGLAVGTWAVIVGAAVLLLWIPLRQRPGFGTVSNVFVIGIVIDLFLAVVHEPGSLALRAVMMLGGVGLNGVATGCYIGAGLGPGPRDGLMLGFARRGHSIRAARTGIELAVLAVGFVLGGTVGVGTVVYALGIGPLAHIFVPLLRLDGRAPVAPVPELELPDAAAA